MDKHGTVPASAGGNKPNVVSDLYDFGGGFYFTLLLGLEGSSMTRGSRRMGPDDGWLIGEAVGQDNSLSGTIAFHPYRSQGIGRPARTEPGQSERAASLPPGRRAWHPKRVTP